MYTLENLNMRYTSEESDNAYAALAAGGECIIDCCFVFDPERLTREGVDIDCAQSIVRWLADPSAVAEGLKLKVWFD